jgi:hypothetical protein
MGPCVDVRKRTATSGVRTRVSRVLAVLFFVLCIRCPQIQVHVFIYLFIYFCFWVLLAPGCPDPLQDIGHLWSFTWEATPHAKKACATCIYVPHRVEPMLPRCGCVFRPQAPTPPTTVPQQLQQAAVVSGSHCNIAADDLLLQHLDETLVTIPKTVKNSCTTRNMWLFYIIFMSKYTKLSNPVRRFLRSVDKGTKLLPAHDPYAGERLRRRGCGACGVTPLRQRKATADGVVPFHGHDITLFMDMAWYCLWTCHGTVYGMTA